jgi:predicted peroxiredoxin
MPKILYYGNSGTNDPTRAGLVFNHALGAIEAGMQAEIFLAGEATHLMKDRIVREVFPVAMPPLKEMLGKVIEHQIPIYV